MRMRALVLLLASSWITNAFCCAQQIPATEVSAAARRSIALLDNSTRSWLKTAECFSCHHQAYVFRVARIAREHGLPVDESLLVQNAQKSLVYIGSIDDVIQGADFIDPPLVDGLELRAAHDVGVPQNLAYATLARRIATLQRPAGNWITSDRRAPQAASSFSSTVAAIEAIQAYFPPRLADIERQSLARARHWLATATPADVEDSSMDLIGLDLVGAPKDDIAARAKPLVARQRGDGGWAQILTRQSDAYATGQALVALAQSGALKTTEAVYQRGLRFLLDTQKPDGSWLVPTRLRHPLPINPPDFDMQFPYGSDKITSFFGTCWATMALALALDDHSAAPASVPPGAWEQLLPVPEDGWVETALFGNAGDLKKLLDGGLDPNATTHSGTPLIVVVALDKDKVTLLLDRGADVNAAAKSRFNALMVAANHGGTGEVVRILLHRGAKVRPERSKLTVPTAVYLSTGTGEHDITQLLLDQGDDARRIWLRFGVSPYTPLRNAVDMRDAELVRILAKAGGDVNERGNNHGVSLLSLAVLSNAPDVVSALLDLGADVNAVDDLGMTPLHYASMSDFGDTRVAHVLLAAGAGRDLRTKEGLTPEQLARKLGYPDIAAVLKAKH
jgi:ankyrin repeat protein